MDTSEKIISQKQYEDIVKALETIFGFNAERLIKAIYEAKANGKNPVGIAFPIVKLWGLPIQISTKVDKPMVIVV